MGRVKDFIEACQIFLKYGDIAYPFACEHDILYVFYDGSVMSDDDLDRLELLGFNWDDDEQHFYSFKYGSA